jgi:hypothetical protein
MKCPPSPPKKPPTSTKSNPQNNHIFDPWNSSSTGHQCAENPFSGTTSWRDTRSAKLKQQFRGEDCPRDRAGALGDQDFSAKAFDGTCGSVSPVAESYEAGNRSVNGSTARAGEWRWVSDEEAKRAHLGVRDIRCFMGVGKRKAGNWFQVQMQGVKKAKNVPEQRREKGELHATPSTTMAKPTPAPTSTTVTAPKSSTISTRQPPPTSKSNPEPDRRQSNLSTTNSSSSTSKIFTGTTIYINGSTLPQISDHKLKSLLAAHGATIAIGMARRTVSHVIIGQPGTMWQGAGGGLAAGKLQGEIERGGWKGVRVVGVDW